MKTMVNIVKGIPIQFGIAYIPNNPYKSFIQSSAIEKKTSTENLYHKLWR